MSRDKREAQAREEQVWAHGDTVLPFSLNTSAGAHPTPPTLPRAPSGKEQVQEPPQPSMPVAQDSTPSWKSWPPCVREDLCLLLTSCNEGTSQKEA